MLSGFLPQSVFNQPLKSAFSAAAVGDNKGIKSFILGGGDPNSVNSCGDTLLHVAGHHNHKATVKLLLNEKANPNARNRCNYTLMEVALFNYYPEIIQSLLEAKAEVPPSSLRAGGEFFNILKKDDAATLRLLIPKIDINIRNSVLVREASKVNASECLKVLVEAKIDLTKADHLGNAAVHVACYQANSTAKCLSILLEAKANINRENADRDLPSHIAIYHGKVDCLKILVEQKIDVNKTNKSGNTVAHIASSLYPTALPFLLEQPGVDLSVINKDGNTVMDIANNAKNTLTESHAHTIRNSLFQREVERTEVIVESLVTDGILPRDIVRSVLLHYTKEAVTSEELNSPKPW